MTKTNNIILKNNHNYTTIEKQGTKINYSTLEKKLNSLSDLQCSVKEDKVALFKTYQKKFLFKKENIYFILDLDKYDEKEINKQIAIISTKYDNKYESEYGNSEDFENKNIFILLVINKWDKEAENFVNSEDFGIEYGFWITSKFYLIYDNKIYYQTNPENSIRNEKEYNKIVMNLLND